MTQPSAACALHHRHQVARSTATARRRMAGVRRRCSIATLRWQAPV